jgi:alkylation response protein AidB-like acyl-CoA dehydrogenase
MSEGGSAGLTEAELEHYRDLARQYAKRSLLPMFQGEHPDGDLSTLPERIDTAFEVGLAASPIRSMPGSQYGIWGSATEEMGFAPSLHLLSTIAESCGGVAMALHAQGLASNLMLQERAERSFTPRKVALCLQEGLSPPGLGTLLDPSRDAPARIGTTAELRGGGWLLRGAKHFCHSAGEPDGLLVFARTGEEWGCFVVPASDAGVARTDVGARTGLRACRVEQVELRDVALPAGARLDGVEGRKLVLRALSLSWAGMTAIAVGIARGAVAAARKYAAERYQGGSQIEEHPAVQGLLAGAEAATAAAEASCLSLAGSEPGTVKGLARAAAAKLASLELCARATTDALQVFGGYGYMEDYGMEKRLRDVTALKSASGAPPYLRRLLFEAARENGS